MKKYIGILLMSLFVASCAQQEMIFSDIDSTFYAEIEQPAPDDLTKTYYDTDSDKVLWDNGDLLTLFTGTSAPLQYKFVGGTGVTGGKLILSDNSGASSGDAISHNYAVYPYSEDNGLDGNEKIVIKTSGIQTYPGFDSFGENDNIMVAASDNTSFSFKNACGWIILGLSGEGQVSSITLQGNANEIIAGDFAVTATVGGNPAIEPRVKGTKFTNLREITLECPEPVTLSSTMTDFWIVVPPTVFSSGFSFTVTDPTGRTCTKDVPVSYTVERAKYRRIATTIAYPAAVENIVFADENFKAYCVDNYDQDGDGEVSREEALAVEEVTVTGMGITSLQGIEFFWNLKCLSCYSNQLSSLDVSNNTALTNLYCDSNQLSSLDVGNLTALQDLNCNSNQLTSLDVSNNTALSYLNCDSNQLSSLDVSNNTALQNLWCHSNHLSSLNVSNCTALQDLRCFSNQLSSLDVSNNTALSYLDCRYNQLSVLDVSNYSALQTLLCNINQLSSLDVSNCTALQTLDCRYNQLSSLDVSNNTALTNLLCDSNQLSSLDVSNNAALIILSCGSNPYITEIWLKMGQTIENMQYDTDVVTIKYKGIPEAVDLGLSVKWASHNVGASEPEEFGDYYAWGETESKESYSWDNYKWHGSGYATVTKYNTKSEYGPVVDNNNDLDYEDDIANTLLGGSWRIPSRVEMQELIDNCRWEYCELNGVSGLKITSEVQNYTDRWIFLPFAGHWADSFSGYYSVFGYFGDYWTSIIGERYPCNAYFLNIGFGNNDSPYPGVALYSISDRERYYGHSIRPVSN